MKMKSENENESENEMRVNMKMKRDNERNDHFQNQILTSQSIFGSFPRKRPPLFPGALLMTSWCSTIIDNMPGEI
jgi:hypothetical protein